MKKFLNLKIGAKLIIAFFVISLIAGIVGIVGLVNLNKVNQADTQLYEENTLGIDRIAKADIYFQRVRFNVLNMMINVENREEYMKKVETYSETVNNYLKEYKATIYTQQDQEKFDILEKNWKDYSSYVTTIMEDIKNNKLEEAKALTFGDAADTGNVLMETFDSLFEYNTNGAEAKSQRNDQLATSAMGIMLIIVIGGIILAIAFGIVISRIISKPIIKMVDVANKLAIGDVNVNVDVNTKDEVGNLAQAFNGMIANIRSQALTAERIASGDLTVEVKVSSEKDLLGKKLYELVEKNNEVLNSIADASDQVASGSKQVSDSSVALSQGATEQASSVEELTSSLEEISSQTKLNADNANQANQLAEIAKANALQGNTQMKEMQRAMEEINVSSSNISKIIKVIDEIAFQTNILALNAAVEAARAGQHGKGFAVVAEEVRNLAARSANAAKETTDMIEGSIRKVEAGTKIADETAQALNKIVEDVAKAATLVNAIATASNEQAAGIEQINQGIIQVSQVVQTNSATAEESAAASEELSSQAELLKDSISKFKLKKVRRTYNKYEELDTDVINMIENRMDRNKTAFSQNDTIQNKKESKTKIMLNDREFGKY